MANDPEPHVLDQPWRLWATVAVIGILLAGVILGVIVIPVVQGRAAGIDAYTAICRAIGILPGSPAQRQTVDRTPSTPVSQVVWTPDVLQVLARANPERGRAKVLEVCAACHGEQGVSPSTEFPHLAGQSGAAIYKQLHDYRTGSRTHELMTDRSPSAGPIPPRLAVPQMLSSNWLSLATRRVTCRLAHHVTGQAPAGRSRRPFCPSSILSTLLNSFSCTRRARDEMTCTVACVSSPLD
jgi:cytochrome c553